MKNIENEEEATDVTFEENNLWLIFIIYFSLQLFGQKSNPLSEKKIDEIVKKFRKISGEK